MQANIAWAFSVLGHSPGPELLEAIAQEAEKKIAEFTAQNISNLLWAFAKLEHMPATFLACASLAARALLTQCTPQVSLSAECCTAGPEGNQKHTSAHAACLLVGVMQLVVKGGPKVCSLLQCSMPA